MNIDTAQTIAQAKATTPSFLDFLLAFPGTMEAQMFYALILGALIGMIGHYVRGRTAGDIAGNLADYFVHDNLWRSIGALMSVAIELGGEIGAGLFTTSEGVFVGWGLVLLSGIKTGYLGDSLVNKGKRVEWTDEKREAKEAVKTLSDDNVKP